MANDHPAHPDQPTAPTDESRRTLLRSAAVGGVALPLLAACGGGTGTTGSTATDPAGQGSAVAGGTSPDGSGGGLVATSDVPVGGGVVLGEQQVVVTQPTQGEFVAFTAVCTHQGCTVGSVTDGTIICPCHGSTFSAEDGSVVNGPASAPLSEIQVTVEGDQVVRA